MESYWIIILCGSGFCEGGVYVVYPGGISAVVGKEIWVAVLGLVDIV